MRIDKWLWAARFYKTRSLASAEIDLGRVQINGQAIKPAREVKVGDLVQCRTGVSTRTVTVMGLSDQRGSAPVAAKLYQETEASQQQRLAAAQQRRLAPEPALTLTQGRPTKKDRRNTDKLHRGQWDERWSATL